MADAAPEANRRHRAPRVLDAGSVLTIIAPGRLRYRSHLNPGTLSHGVGRTGRARPANKGTHLAGSLKRERLESVRSSTRDEPVVALSIGSW